MENFDFNKDDIIRAKVALFLWLQQINHEKNCSDELGYSQESLLVLYKNQMNVKKTYDKFTRYVKEIIEK